MKDEKLDERIAGIYRNSFHMLIAIIHENEAEADLYEEKNPDKTPIVRVLGLDEKNMRFKKIWDLLKTLNWAFHHFRGQEKFSKVIDAWLKTDF